MNVLVFEGYSRDLGIPAGIEQDGWTYEVIPDLDAPTEYAAIAVYDEKHEFIQYWNQF